MTPRYVRSLSPYERMWIAAQRSCFFALIEGKGQISATKLREAIETAAATNPGCRLELRGIGPWAHWVEVDTLPTVTEVDGQDWDGHGSDKAPFSDQEHMDVCHAPSTSYVIIHGETTRLIQRSHHATMDGMGALQFARDVFSAMRGDVIRGAMNTDTDLALAHRLGGRMRKISHQCIQVFANPSTGISGSIWRRLRVNKKIHAHPLALTLHAIAKIARQTHEGDVLIDLPVNLRTLFPDLSNTGNLTGSLRLNIESSATPDSIAQLLEHELNGHHQADALAAAAPVRYLPIILMRQLANAQARRAILQNRFSPTAVVSNLGHIDTTAFSSSEFQAESAIIIPPAYDGVPLFLQLSSNSEGFELAARAPKALGAEGRLESLLIAIAEILAKT